MTENQEPRHAFEKRASDLLQCQPVPDPEYFDRIWQAIDKSTAVKQKVNTRPLYMVSLALLAGSLIFLLYVMFIIALLSVRPAGKTSFISLNGHLLGQFHLGAGESMQPQTGISVLALLDSWLFFVLDEPGGMQLRLQTGHVQISLAARQKLAVLLWDDWNMLMQAGSVDMFAYADMCRMRVLAGAAMRVQKRGQTPLTIAASATLYIVHGAPIVYGEPNR